MGQTLEELKEELRIGNILFAELTDKCRDLESQIAKVLKPTKGLRDDLLEADILAQLDVFTYATCCFARSEISRECFELYTRDFPNEIISLFKGTTAR